MATAYSTSFLVTFTGARQQLTLSAARGTPLRMLHFQPSKANVNAMFYGGSTLDADTGIELPAPAGVVLAPFLAGEFNDGSILLEDWYVLGTASQTLRVFVLAHPGPLVAGRLT